MKTCTLVTMALFVFLWASGCEKDRPESPSQILDFTTIEQSNQSAIEDERFIVVADIDSWNKLWAEHSKNIQPTPTAPIVNFNENMLLGVFLGTRPNTCYSVAIESVERVNNERVLVKYRENKGGPVCGQAETEPLHLISIKSIKLPIEFVAQQ